MTEEAKKAKNNRERLRRRRLNLLKKAYEIGKDPEIEVAVIILMHGRFFTYRSTAQKSWPPSMEHIVSLTPTFLKHGSPE